VKRAAFVAAALLACASCAAQPAARHAGAVRIVSLAPSLTEIAYAIGCGPELVGDTRFDDYPAQARALPHVADLVKVDLEKVAQLAPTAVIALHDEEKEGGAITAGLPGVSVRYLPNRDLPDLFADIQGVGDACERAQAASRLGEDLRRRIAQIAMQAENSSARPRVLYLLGLPGYTAGKNSFLDDLIRLAGGANVAGDIDEPYPDLSAESIIAMHPDVIVVAHDTPFGSDVRAREPWSSLDAVRAGRVRVPPDDDVMERLGPRVVVGLRWLRDAIRIQASAR
jgi:iron complex transport system substrate-binding protein